MYLLSELFEKCAHKENYCCIGKDVDYSFEEEGTTLYIYFQGSGKIFSKKGWWDWIRNFSFFPKSKQPYKNMKIKYKVHRGFLASWKEVEDTIIAKVTEKKKLNYQEQFLSSLRGEKKNNEYKFKKIVIVGYSLGAALSAFCKECVWYYRPDIRDSTYGFAFESPRTYCGWWVKKKLRERWENFYVFRNKGDLITRLPPMFSFFHHVGTLIHIGKYHCGFFNDHKVDNVLRAVKDYEEKYNVGKF